MEISVIIPTYNRISSIERTFKFIAQSITLPDEVIVVDQSQNIDLANNIKALCNQQPFNAIYIWLSEPSLTKARNVGLSKAQYDTIVFMDDDVDVQKDTFLNVKRLFADSKIAMVGGFDGKPPVKNSFFSYVFNKANYRKRYTGHVSKGIYGRLPINNDENSMPTEWAMGFFFIVRKSLVSKWHLQFDEKFRYYAYAEDLDFTHLYYENAKQEGLKCCYSINCSVTHNVSKEYRTPKRTLCYMMMVHREYIRYKHYGGNKYFMSLLWSSIGDFLFRLLHHEPIKDIIDANMFMLRNRKDIRKGIFHYDQYMTI